MAGIVEATSPAPMTRPLSDRFKPLQIAVIIYMVGEAGLALFGAVELYFLTGMDADPYLDFGTASSAFAIVALIAGLAQLIGLTASVILVSMWTFRAMKNLHIVGAVAATMSPGWAVGWYFIPFANLWKPFEGVLQIWRESHRLAGRPEKVAAYVGWWWATWLISNFLANISVRLTGFVEALPTYNAGVLVGVVGSALSVVCGFLLLRTTRQVTQVQTEMHSGGLADTFG
ncbi:DUF4328 domain-containing protein [Hyphomonas sp. WL0036]|uniref:DUF4328 domain-containing protein n=1 Tax=Hyphomonas sediminis TaxID=2866160 RepID=UPI001C822344|nr:DUF4328 domain-containing protein [Hyphomonas sediminis]MBY9066193.1 DUF4328 domain-containing protein [Hyphomonas sediminis]